MSRARKPKPAPPKADPLEGIADRRLNTAHAAAYLDVHPTTLRKWRMSTNEGPPYETMPNGYSIRYRLDQLREWLERGGRRAA